MTSESFLKPVLLIGQEYQVQKPNLKASPLPFYRVRFLMCVEIGFLKEQVVSWTHY